MGSFSIPASSSGWNSDHDERLAVNLLFGAGRSFVGDMAMTHFWQSQHPSLKRSYWVGTPDATFFGDAVGMTDDESLLKESWENVTMMQTTRAYNRLHLHALIGEKLYKSACYIANVIKVRRRQAFFSFFCKLDAASLNSISFNKTYQSSERN